jgi:ClpP class serine protease
MDLSFLSQQLFNQPLALSRRDAQTAVAELTERVGQAKAGPLAAPAPGAWYDDDYDYRPGGTSNDPGYDLVAGVAVIPISGILVPEAPWLRGRWGVTGYNGLRQSFLTAIADEDARAVAFSLNSGGGAVARCLDLSDTIHGARGIKPIAAILSENAYSAAYVLASAVDPGRIYVPRTGGTGSNGVICMHVDLSAALEKFGVKVTFFTSAGADRKADGNPEIALSEEAAAAIQADVDAMGTLLHETVGRNRGLSPDAVRGQAAATFMGAAGVAAGLADAVMAPDAAFAALLADLD